MLGSISRTASNLVGIDANAAAADVAYRMSEMTFMFPITPSSPMGEYSERWAAEGRKNVFGQVLRVNQMESEGGAAGAFHGAAGLGAYVTTFTASQGLMLMLPDIMRMAGDQLPGVFHVAARSVGTFGISIYGDHTDIMLIKPTGVAMLGASSPQEAHDMAAIAHAASINLSFPFIHYFDGFRTSHEINSVSKLTDDQLRSFIDQDAVTRFKMNSLSPDHPVQRGNIYPIELMYQFAVKANKVHDSIFPMVHNLMKKFYRETGRFYEPFMYHGAEDATDVIIAMGSGAKTIQEYCEYSNKLGGKLGCMDIHLYRPFNAEFFLSKLPNTIKRVTILDKSMDPLASSEPLYLELSSHIRKKFPGIKICDGKFGISGKNFNPTHVAAVVRNMQSGHPIERFNVGINDDVTNTSLPAEKKIIDTVPEGTTQCIFWGFGSDGLVGAAKDAIKIIADNTELYGQGHFEYTAHKSGGITTSYLRFGPQPIVSPYLIQEADYICCSKPSFVERFDMADNLKENGIIVFNAPSEKTIDEFLPNRLKKKIAEKNGKLYTIDATKLANKFGLAGRTNTIMQSVFFLLSGVLPVEKAVELMKDAAKKTYGRKGDAVVEKNVKLIDAARDNYQEIKYDRKKWLALEENQPFKIKDAPPSQENIVSALLRQKGNDVPVSWCYDAGINPPGATQFEKRGIASIVPEWKANKCIQCGLCSTICPHSVIRPFLLTDKEAAEGKIEVIPSKVGKELEKYKFTIQVSAYDCTGCSKCANICPVSALEMKPADPLYEPLQERFDYVRKLPIRGDDLPPTSPKNVQFRQPLLEFSGACAGCGETGIVKMVSQLYGDRSYFTFATGCPVVWGGSACANAYTTNPEGKGPTWSSSLFEDAAEYGYGQQKTLDMRREFAKLSVEELHKQNPSDADIKKLIEKWNDAESTEIAAKVIAKIEKRQYKMSNQLQTDLLRNKDYMSQKIQWIFGGDGWAYDIGYNGLDHILASGENVNVIVLDTEVYSNTGGQPSKGSARGSSTSFSAKGVGRKKKDLAKLCMTYNNIYVATTCLDADPKQALRSITEAVSYNGPSIIINYSPCIEQGFNQGLGKAPAHTRDLVKAGYIILSRFDPRLIGTDKTPLQLDSKKPVLDIDKALESEVRFNNLSARLPERYEKLRTELHADLTERYNDYVRISESYKLKL